MRKELIWILGCGATLRVLHAFYSTGYLEPNEIYRLLEPIAALQGYGTRLPWEWTDGLLSEIPARAHWILIQVFSSLGVSSAWTQALLLRVLYALLSSSVILAGYQLVRWAGDFKKNTEIPALFAAAGLALWPEWIYRSARLMDYSAELIVYSMVSILLFQKSPKKHPRSDYVASVLFGILFFFRFQSGLIWISFLLALGWTQKRSFSRLFEMLGMYGMTVVCLATLESMITQQSFLSPFVHYLEYNVLKDGATKDYGADPWHRYFTESAKVFGFLPFLGLLFLSLRGNRTLQILFFFPFLVYCLIPHKEDRFILGFLWLWVPLALSSSLALSLQKLSVFRKAILGLALLISFGLQLQRNLPRVSLHRDVVRDFAEIGEEKRRPWPLIIGGDPDFLPGGFFLKNHHPICYPLTQNCNAFQETPHYRVYPNSEGKWTLEKI